MSPDEQRNDGGLSTDEIFDVLGHEHRRHAISALREHDGETTLGRLVEETSNRTDDDPHRIAIAFQHSHLPRLQGTGVVTYDADRDRVELTDAATDLEPFFELTGE